MRDQAALGFRRRGRDEHDGERLTRRLLPARRAPHVLPGVAGELPMAGDIAPVARLAGDVAPLHPDIPHAGPAPVARLPGDPPARGRRDALVARRRDRRVRRLGQHRAGAGEAEDERRGENPSHGDASQMSA